MSSDDRPPAARTGTQTKMRDETGRAPGGRGLEADDVSPARNRGRGIVWGIVAVLALAVMAAVFLAVV